MIASWMVYAVAVSLVLAIGARMLEWGCENSLRPGRWGWVAALAASIAIPIFRLFSTTSASRTSEIPDGAFGAAIRLPARLVSLGGVSPSAAWSTLDSILVVAWIACSGVLLLLLVRDHAALARTRARWPTIPIDGQLVLVSESVGPAVIGGRAPQVVLPRWTLALDPDRRALVLAHEREHIAAGDTLLLTASRVITTITPWNPVVWYAHRRLRQAVEVDCDRRVLSTYRDPHAYGETILQVARLSARSPAVLATLSEPFSQLGRRITVMTSRPRRHRHFALALGLTTASVAVLVACQTERPASASADTGAAARAVLASPPAESGEAFFEFQVETPVQALSGGTQPRYPDILRQARVEGEVLAQFVVDTTGHAEIGSYKVLKTTHELFGNAVRDALPGMRYSAAMIGGRPVRQVVQQPFTFALAR